MPTAAAIYARISKDDKGDLLGVQRQERDCRLLASRKGWPVAQVFVDDDVSAYVPGRRPGYAALLDALKAGRIDAVVVYDLDRLHRHPAELESFFTFCDAASVTDLASVAGDVNLGTADGQFHARIMGAVARKESEDKARRLRRKHDELAERGRWAGGPRPYGYRSLGDGALGVEAAEADVVREAARRVLGGESVYGICADFNRREVPTAQGARWRTPTLRRILTSPTTAGFRDHHGEVVGRAGWDPILDEVTWRRLVAVIDDPTRSKARPARSYLLTGGIARCGRCGSPLHAQRRSSGAKTYACVGSDDKGGCGGLTAAAEPLEAIVTEAVLLRVDTPALAAALVERRGAGVDDGALDTLAEVDGRMVELADMFAAGEIGRAEWVRARKGLEGRQEAARAAVSRQRRTTALDPYAGRPGALRAAWPDLTLDQRRAVISTVVDRVIVNPAPRQGPVFDPARLDVVWRA